VTTRIEPTVLDVIQYRENSGQDISFTLVGGLAANITEAKLYVRDIIDGTRKVAVKYTDDITKWTLADGANASSVTPGPTDTNTAPGGIYIYDIQIEYTDGTERTVQVGDFELIGNISTDAATDTPLASEYHLSQDWYDAFTAANSPSLSNAVATIADVEASDTLAEVLANGNTTGANDIIISDGQAIQTAQLAGDLAYLKVYDVDGAAYVDVLTMTANNTPTADLNTIVTIDGAYIYRGGGTDVPILDGGTGASTAVDARTNLGLAIGSDVQAWDVNLDQIAALTPANSLMIGNGLGSWSTITPADFITDNNIADSSDSLDFFSATTSAELAGVISDETGSGALVFATSPVITTDITIPNTGLHLLDTNASHDLIIAPGSDLTADRQLTLTTGDAARTITLSGNPTLSDWFDQSVKTTASPTFVTTDLTGITDGNIPYMSASGFADSPLSTDGTDVFINDTSNAFMDLGLTINQGAADNEIFALKSSDVNHGMTTKAEADTYGAFQKASPGSGGLQLFGLSNDANAAIELRAYPSTGQSTKTTSSVGAVVLNFAKANGTTTQALASDENVFVLRDGYNGLVRYIIDAVGTIHYITGDNDLDLLKLSATTGTPTLSWDESEDKFDFSHGINVSGGATGSFTTVDGKTVTVTNGIVTGIV
jgi:hypothetical protein